MFSKVSNLLLVARKNKDGNNEDFECISDSDCKEDDKHVDKEYHN